MGKNGTKSTLNTQNNLNYKTNNNNILSLFVFYAICFYTETKAEKAPALVNEEVHNLIELTPQTKENFLTKSHRRVLFYYSI